MQRTTVSSLLVVSILALPAAASAGSAAGRPRAERVQGVHVVKGDVSPPLRTLRPIPPSIEPEFNLLEDPGEVPVQRPGFDVSEVPDPLVQDWANWLDVPSPAVSFDGPSNTCGGCSPPDPNGAIGLDQFVTMQNSSFAVYDRSGTLLYGPAANNTLWSGFGGPCQTENAGDPVVLYDQLADRWVLMQFTDSSGPPFLRCVAVSTSSDALGSYQRYSVDTLSNFPDYPKMGLWPDGYYFSTREFPSSGQDRAGAYAIDRAAVLAGSLSPTIVGFVVNPASVPVYRFGDGLLPSDLDGFTPPPAGSPAYFIGSMDDGGPDGAPQDALNVWEFHADFATPASSSFALVRTIPIAPFDTIFSGCSGRNCVPQPGTSVGLDILSYRQRPLHRAAYRNFGSHESIVTNQSVEAASGVAGIRWWEIRNLSGTATLYQEGTFAPGTTDGIHRWMGSIAMDASGDIGLGYSASDGSSTFPSVWYTGRLASDPLGTMPQGEGSIVDGGGSQTSSGSRWGDYTALTVDPLDDCTFWYVNEYLPTTSSTGYRLRVGAFKFPECGDEPPPPPATVTVTFDSVASQDGRTWERTETSNTGGGSNSSNNNTASIRVGDLTSDRQYRSIVSFDTSSLPDGAQIVSARLILKRGTLSGTDPFTTHGNCVVDIRTGAFGTSASLSSSDFQAAATATGVATLTRPTGNGALSEGVLNATGRAAINKTGTTQLKLYFTLDDNDDNGYDYVGFYSGESASANRPKLEVTYQP